MVFLWDSGTNKGDDNGGRKGNEDCMSTAHVRLTGFIWVNCVVIFEAGPSKTELSCCGTANRLGSEARELRGI